MLACASDLYAVTVAKALGTLTPNVIAWKGLSSIVDLIHAMTVPHAPYPRIVIRQELCAMPILRTDNVHCLDSGICLNF